MTTTTDNQESRLVLLRKPFKDTQISKLPKPTKFQTDAVKKDYKTGTRCNLCGGWHHPKVVHLDYVGHAALTDRLLDVDPLWDWEPLAFNDNGLPLIDSDGGMWIRLTVCGQSRLGYGDAPNKKGGNATKEMIGDALRNAAMRFGAALDLWHKGELHDEDVDDPQHISLEKLEEGIDWFIGEKKTAEALDKWFDSKSKDIASLDKTDHDKAHGCYKESRAILVEMHSKPETIICPENNKPAVKEDCLQSECHKTCKHFTGQSKMEINIK